MYRRLPAVPSTGTASAAFPIPAAPPCILRAVMAVQGVLRVPSCLHAAVEALPRRRRRHCAGDGLLYHLHRLGGAAEHSPQPRARGLGGHAAAGGGGAGCPRPCRPGVDQNNEINMQGVRLTLLPAVAPACAPGLWPWPAVSAPLAPSCPARPRGARRGCRSTWWPAGCPSSRSCSCCTAPVA